MRNIRFGKNANILVEIPTVGIVLVIEWKKHKTYYLIMNARVMLLWF